MTTLYKMNNTNSISWWTIEQHDTDYSIKWGQRLSGKEHGHNYYSCTTAQEAAAKVASLTKHQIEREGYSLERPKSQPDKPMLAQRWEDRKEKFDWTLYSLQPKLNGLRCIATQESITSRRLERIVSLPNIESILSYLEPNEKLDGELYIHGVDLQTLQSYVMRNRAHKLHYMVEYHVYDYVDLELPFVERSLQLNSIVKRLTEIHRELYRDYCEIPEKLRRSTVAGLQQDCPIKLVPTHTYTRYAGINHKEVISNYFRDCRKEGYEGCMIRNGDSLYELDYRSPNLLKYKEKMDAEFEIIDVSPGYNQTGIFVCKTKDGGIFEATPKWTTERKRYLLANKERFVGRFLTVEFEDYSRDGIPLKPIGIATRTDV